MHKNICRKWRVSGFFRFCTARVLYGSHFALDFLCLFFVAFFAICFNQLISSLKISEYICDTCNRPFSTQTNLNRHKKDFHSAQPLPTKSPSIRCNECPASFVYRSSLIEHLQKVHSKNPVIQTHICNSKEGVYFIAI